MSNSHSFTLDGKLVLVTGASSGIGKELAVVLTKMGIPNSRQQAELLFSCIDADNSGGITPQELAGSEAALAGSWRSAPGIVAGAVPRDQDRTVSVPGYPGFSRIAPWRAEGFREEAGGGW